jgi:hypothetical protein
MAEILPLACLLDFPSAKSHYAAIDRDIAAEESQSDGHPVSAFLCEPEALHDVLAARAAVVLDAGSDFAGGQLTLSASSRLRAAERASAGGRWRVAVRGLRAEGSSAGNLLHALQERVVPILQPPQPPLPMGGATVVVLHSDTKDSLEAQWEAEEAARRRAAGRGSPQALTPASLFARFQLHPSCGTDGEALAAALNSDSCRAEVAAAAAAAAAAQPPRAAAAGADGVPVPAIALLALLMLLFFVMRTSGGSSSSSSSAPPLSGGAKSRRGGGGGGGGDGGGGGGEEEEREVVEGQPPPHPPRQPAQRSRSTRRTSPGETTARKAKTT